MYSYNEFFENIYSLTKGHSTNPSLSTITTLCKIYNQPQNAFPTIHVAGTNGKGSVCTKIATSLEKGGYRVGLYTSPHISSFCERIQINGVMVTDVEAHDILKDILHTLHVHEITATFFEVTTLLAFLIFRKMNVDVAVIETGIGGTWDATNVIKPILSIITSIGYDHMDLLGTTLEEIAQEKAGIIKPHTPLVIGPDVPLESMQRAADRFKSALYQNTIRSRDYDVENAETASLSLTRIQKQFPISQEAITCGLTAKPPCRFEVHVREKTVIFDVAHNIHGIDRLLEKLLEQFPHRRYRFVVGFSKGKDLSSCAKAIESKALAVHLVSGTHPRLASVEEIVPYFTPERVVVEPSIKGALERCLRAKDDDIIVITGSFFIMHEAKNAIA